MLDKTKPESKMGRPAKDFDWEIFYKYLKTKPTLADASEFMSTEENPISEDTIANRIRAKHDCTYTELREKKMAGIRRSLVQKALDMALNGGNATMLIFSLKNLCGWRDIPIEEEDEDIPLKIKFKKYG
jgi:hypothetical protein